MAYIESNFWLFKEGLTQQLSESPNWKHQPSENPTQKRVMWMKLLCRMITIWHMASSHEGICGGLPYGRPAQGRR